MPPRSLVDPLTATDAGGVAGRRGFRYQDHVAACFFLDMLFDSRIAQIECETADDIVIRWNFEGEKVNEYVQVKTTEADSKWALGELTARKKTPKVKGGAIGSSLMEKSLNGDAYPSKGIFRFVSKRDVRAILAPFCIPRNQRNPPSPQLLDIIARVAKEYPTFKSKNGNGLEYWAKNLLWVVEPSQHLLRTKNVNKIIQFGEHMGAVPTHSLAEKIYDLLLIVVGDAADASQVTEADQKSITRSEAHDWWVSRSQEIKKLQKSTVKVYSVNTDNFFNDLHYIDDITLRRFLKSYDVDYDFQQWRSEELAAYLIDFLPEISLPAKVLAEFDHLDARKLVPKAVTAFESITPVNYKQLVAELMLHALLRHYFQSEPIACKIFARASTQTEPSGAHIVRQPDGDQLWIGRAKMTTVTEHDSILNVVISEIETFLTKDFLKSERDLIIKLREPQHMMPTSIEGIFQTNSKAEDVLKALNVPILIAYDSGVLSKGYQSDYIDKLKVEVENSYTKIRGCLSSKLDPVSITVFLIPVECAKKLVSNFVDMVKSPA